MSALHDLQPNPGTDDQADDEPRLVDTDPSVAGTAAVQGLGQRGEEHRATAHRHRPQYRGHWQVCAGYRPQTDSGADVGTQDHTQQVGGPHRVFDAAEFPLAGFKAIKNAAGVTLNDVALGVIGGALQRYLQSRGEAPAEGSLAAAIPLNMRTRRDMTADNNQVGSVFASCTDIADPMERLQAIKQGTAEAKVSGESSPMVDADEAGRRVLAAGQQGRRRYLGAQRVVPVYSTECLDLYFQRAAGPDFRLYCAGADGRLLRTGCADSRMGVFHLVSSYAGTDAVGAGGPRYHAGSGELPRFPVASYEELHGAAGPGSARKGQLPL